MPQQKGGSAKKKTFTDLCNSFADACLEAVGNDSDDEPFSANFDDLVALNSWVSLNLLTLSFSLLVAFVVAFEAAALALLLSLIDSLLSFDFVLLRLLPRLPPPDNRVVRRSPQFLNGEDEGN